VRLPERARYALVVYPDNTIGCIPLGDVEDAIAKRGAVVIGREFERVTPKPIAQPEGEDDGA